MSKLNTGQKVGIGLGATVGVVALIFASKAQTAPSPEGWCCPYCDLCFPTYQELVDHVIAEHPNQRIPLPIEWD